MSSSNNEDKLSYYTKVIERTHRVQEVIDKFEYCRKISEWAGPFYTISRNYDESSEISQTYRKLAEYLDLISEIRVINRFSSDGNGFSHIINYFGENPELHIKDEYEIVREKLDDLDGNLEFLDSLTYNEPIKNLAITVEEIADHNPTDVNELVKTSDTLSEIYEEVDAYVKFMKDVLEKDEFYSNDSSKTRTISSTLRYHDDLNKIVEKLTPDLGSRIQEISKYLRDKFDSDNPGYIHKLISETFSRQSGIYVEHYQYLSESVHRLHECHSFISRDVDEMLKVLSNQDSPEYADYVRDLKKFIVSFGGVDAQIQDIVEFIDTYLDDVVETISSTDPTTVDEIYDSGLTRAKVSVHITPADYEFASSMNRTREDLKRAVSRFDDIYKVFKG